jgi:hypothetical protein
MSPPTQTIGQVIDGSLGPIRGEEVGGECAGCPAPVDILLSEILTHPRPITGSLANTQPLAGLAQESFRP